MAIHKLAIPTDDTDGEFPIWLAVQPCNLNDPDDSSAPCFCGPIDGSITVQLDGSPYGIAPDATFTLERTVIDPNPNITQWAWEGIWPADTECEDPITSIVLSCYSDENVTTLFVDISFGGIIGITLVISTTFCDESSYSGRSSTSGFMPECLGGWQFDAVVNATIMGISGSPEPVSHTLAIDTGDDDDGVPIWLAADCAADVPMTYITIGCCDDAVQIPRVGYAIFTGTPVLTGLPVTYVVPMSCSDDDGGTFIQWRGILQPENECHRIDVTLTVTCSFDLISVTISVSVSNVGAGGGTGDNEIGLGTTTFFESLCSIADVFDFGELTIGPTDGTPQTCIPSQDVTCRFVFGRAPSSTPLNPAVSGSISGSIDRAMYRLAISTGDSIDGLPIWLAELDPCCDGGPPDRIFDVCSSACAGGIKRSLVFTMVGNSGGPETSVSFPVVYNPTTGTWYGSSGDECTPELFVSLHLYNLAFCTSSLLIRSVSGVISQDDFNAMMTDSNTIRGIINTAVIPCDPLAVEFPSSAPGEPAQLFGGPVSCVPSGNQRFYVTE